MSRGSSRSRLESLAFVVLLPIRLTVALFMALSPEDNAVSYDFNMALADEPGGSIPRPGTTTFDPVATANDRLKALGIDKEIATLGELSGLSDDPDVGHVVHDIQAEMRATLESGRLDLPY